SSARYLPVSGSPSTRSSELPPGGSPPPVLFGTLALPTRSSLDIGRCPVSLGFRPKGVFRAIFGVGAPGEAAPIRSFVARSSFATGRGAVDGPRGSLYGFLTGVVPSFVLPLPIRLELHRCV